MEIGENFKTILGDAKKYLSLQLDNARFTVAEKLTIIASVIVLYSMALILGLVALVFLTIGLASLLETMIAPFWIYLIVGGFFIILLVLLFLLKEQLILNPIARFLSRLMLDPPTKKDSNEK